MRCPNYRGGSSYGREFAEALRGARGTKEVTDIVAGIESLVERGWVDPDRAVRRLEQLAEWYDTHDPAAE